MQLGLPDGRYGIVLTARNALGIDTTATVGVTVDRTLVGLSVEPRVFSPNGDGRLDTATFQFQLNGPAQVSLDPAPRHADDRAVFTGPLEAGPQTIEWNGRFRRVVGEREYRADLRATSTVTTTQPDRAARSRPERAAPAAPGVFAADVLGQRAGRRDRGLRREPNGRRAAASPRAASGSRPAALSRRSAPSPAISPGTTAGRSRVVAPLTHRS